MLKALAAAAITLLAGDVLSPAAVEAGCGHYVRTQRPGQTERADEGVPRLPPAPSPCSGPECSRSDHVPVSLPQVPPSNSGNWGCLSALPLPESADLSGLLSPTSLALARDRAPSIFHPPRSLSRSR
jgi:hypothetical protein